MSYFIGADLGTSSLKLLLLDESGVIHKTVSKEYPVVYPKAGWSEQNPEDWWNAFVVGVRELIVDCEADLIKGIGVAGQMHGLVILDQDDNCIRPAILWNDGRTQKQTGYLNQTIGEDRLAQCTANIAFAGFTAPKLLWLQENEPHNFARIDKIMLPKDYINYKITGVHSTDYSDAAGMLLLDVEHKRWSHDMLTICGIDETQMPTLHESYEAVGTVTDAIAQQLGLPSGVVVAAGAGDNAAAAIGTGTVGNGKCNISLGTSGTIFVSADQFPKNQSHAIHSFCHADGGYHVMGCILSAASCNKWFCENILKCDDYAALERNIAADKVGHNALFFLPYLMGERSPINDTDATGMFIGLRPDTTREDMQLAVLEGVAFAIKDNLEIVKRLGIPVEESCLCGGGSRSTLWRTIMANVLNITLNIPVSEEGPGYGGAILAMVASGERETVETCIERFFKVKDVIKPQKDLAQAYQHRYETFQKIYPAVRQLYKEMRV